MRNAYFYFKNQCRFLAWFRIAWSTIALFWMMLKTAAVKYRFSYLYTHFKSDIWCYFFCYCWARKKFLNVSRCIGDVACRQYWSARCGKVAPFAACANGDCNVAKKTSLTCYALARGRTYIACILNDQFTLKLDRRRIDAFGNVNVLFFVFSEVNILKYCNRLVTSACSVVSEGAGDNLGWNFSTQTVGQVDVTSETFWKWPCDCYCWFCCPAFVVCHWRPVKCSLRS